MSGGGEVPVRSRGRSRRGGGRDLGSDGELNRHVRVRETSGWGYHGNKGVRVGVSAVMGGSHGVPSDGIEAFASDREGVGEVSLGGSGGRAETRSGGQWRRSEEVAGAPGGQRRGPRWPCPGGSSAGGGGWGGASGLGKPRWEAAGHKTPRERRSDARP